MTETIVDKRCVQCPNCEFPTEFSTIPKGAAMYLCTSCNKNQSMKKIKIIDFSDGTIIDSETGDAPAEKEAPAAPKKKISVQKKAAVAPAVTASKTGNTSLARASYDNKKPAKKEDLTLTKISTLIDRKEVDTQIKSVSKMNGSKMAQVIVFAANKTPKILKCSPASLLYAALDSARAGMYPDGKQAAFVPYFNSSTGETEAKFTPMARGIISAAINKKIAKKIEAREVYDNDFFQCTTNEFGEMQISHEINLKESKGHICGAYCIILLENGEKIVEVLRKEDLEAAESVAKSKDIWNLWRGEMCRKTAIRRAAKYLPDSDDMDVLFDIEMRSEIGAKSYSQELKEIKSA